MVLVVSFMDVLDLAKRGAKRAVEEGAKVAGKGLRELDRIADAVKQPPDVLIVRDLVNVRRAYQSTLDRMSVTIEKIRDGNAEDVSPEEWMEFEVQMQSNLDFLTEMRNKYAKLKLQQLKPDELPTFY